VGGLISGKPFTLKKNPQGTKGDSESFFAVFSFQLCQYVGQQMTTSVFFDLVIIVMY